MDQDSVYDYSFLRNPQGWVEDVAISDKSPAAVTPLQASSDEVKLSASDGDRSVCTQLSTNNIPVLGRCSCPSPCRDKNSFLYHGFVRFIMVFFLVFPIVNVCGMRYTGVFVHCLVACACLAAIFLENSISDLEGFFGSFGTPIIMVGLCIESFGLAWCSYVFTRYLALLKKHPVRECGIFLSRHPSYVCRLLTLNAALIVTSLLFVASHVYYVAYNRHVGFQKSLILQLTCSTFSAIGFLVLSTMLFIETRVLAFRIRMFIRRAREAPADGLDALVSHFASLHQAGQHFEVRWRSHLLYVLFGIGIIMLGLLLQLLNKGNELDTLSILQMLFTILVLVVIPLSILIYGMASVHQQYKRIPAAIYNSKDCKLSQLDVDLLLRCIGRLNVIITLGGVEMNYSKVAGFLASSAATIAVFAIRGFGNT